MVVPPKALSLDDAVAALQARGRFGVRLGLGRIRALLHELGSPESGLRGALIGGTNGKGSVQAMVGAVLLAGGRSVGQTPKPHLVDYRERIVVDGRLLAPADFAAALQAAIAADERVSRATAPATEFEILTAAAFLAFASAAVDVAVVEVGLGGRLDATNAWDGGVAAITNVALDHVEHLGPTEAAIGREKAAIIKRGDLAVTGAAGDGLVAIRRRARRLGVALHEVALPAVLGMDRGGLTVALPDLGAVRVGLLGRHQAGNAAVALATLDALRRAGIADATADEIRQGLGGARWPGRLELLALDDDGRVRPAMLDAPVPGRPDVLLDGAHNPAGMAAFVAALDELRDHLSPGRPTLLLGLMGDKDVDGILGPLVASAALSGARIITTQVDAARALPADDLAVAWRSRWSREGQSGSTVTAAGLEDALGAAIMAAREADGPLIVVGSLYLIGAVRGRLVTEDHEPTGRR
ncbi:MAG TPA: Mur ligase family protein [Candidatus Limnocylindrales bacterium]|jgi:dihydrofolate synthase/folylpolyglutamate synthase